MNSLLLQRKTKILFILIIIGVSLRLFITGTMVKTVSSPDNAFAEQKGGENSGKKESLDTQLLKAFEQRKASLDKKEKTLKRKEEQLLSLKNELEERITSFKKLKIALEELVTTKKDLDEKSLRHLVKVYETMKPESAAPLIEQLDRKITISILSRMKGKNVGKILSKVDERIATKISEQIAKRK